MVTGLGKPQTLQDDGDALMFLSGTLHLLDVASTTSQGALYTINTTNGAATTARGVGTLNVATGAMTKLGADIPNTTYPNQHFTGLLSVPKPSCP